MLQKLPGLLVRGVLFSSLLFFFAVSPFSYAGCTDYFSCNQEIERVKGEISRLRGLENTLANQIAYLTNQIYLTELEIQAKQAEIDLLSGDIGELTLRLERIASFLAYQEEIFTARSRSAYISNQISPLDVVLGADNLDEVIRKIKYLRVLEQEDREVLGQMYETRISFNEQKAALEGKKADVERLKAEVEAHQQGLVVQRATKDGILQETRGEESNYQQLLKKLQGELNSILAALRAGGTRIDEPAVRGMRITNQGNTGCTTWPGGYHIHYAVGVGPVGSSLINYFADPWGFVGLSGDTVVDGAYYSPGDGDNYLTQGAWWRHVALDLVSNSGGVFASESGTAYLLQDTTWFGSSWCPIGCQPGGYCYKTSYDGPAYGIVIDHGTGYKTLYWHIQP